ncbi:hypothetical protein [Sulfuricurvum sp.]|uniref:hypothetical protein n=1 Tax=Sulfuricurvum sp. TaxID=2025608 RepID=UPI003BB493FE
MKNEIWFEAGDKKIDLTKLTRLYPAVVIHAAGESASVSLEWAEMKADHIQIETYILVCDFDPIGSPPLNRIELCYSTKEALFLAMQEIREQFIC